MKNLRRSLNQGTAKPYRDMLNYPLKVNRLPCHCSCRWRKSQAVETLIGNNLGSVSPSWAKVVVTPVGLESKLKEEQASRTSSTRRSGNLYLRRALSNSMNNIMDEKRIG